MDWRHATGPTIMDVAQVFDKPLVFATQFNGGPNEIYYLEWLHGKIDGMAQDLNRTNLYLQDSRFHMRRIGLEGTSNTRNVEGPARNDQEHGHRCTGQQGGHADLVGWDLTEFLYDQIGNVVTHTETVA